MGDSVFPDRPQGADYPSKKACIAAAREVLGGKAKPRLNFTIIREDFDCWRWVGASEREYLRTQWRQRGNITTDQYT